MICYLSWLGFHCWRSAGRQQVPNNRKSEIIQWFFFSRVSAMQVVFIQYYLTCVCISLFSCTTKLSSSLKDNMKAFDLANQHLMYVYCIPVGFFTVTPLLLFLSIITYTDSVSMNRTSCSTFHIVTDIYLASWHIHPLKVWFG